ncbi:MAG: hypothetical protein NUW01_04770 [Gemmatimonadaceae bacterium]|nr:hypothetical protein [Gemmatimonadaceae bacterium]
MAVEGIITLGIGSSPGGLFSFFTLGLTPSVIPDVEIAGTLTGTGSFTGTLAGVASITGTLTGTGAVSGTLELS